MEQAVLRGRAGHPVLLGERVLVGPHAHVNGAEVGDEVFVATGASLFPGSRVGAGAEIRINGVLHVNSALPPGAVVPIGWVAVGDPAAILPPGSHDEIWEIQRTLDFVGTVAGVDADALGRGERHGRADGDLRSALRPPPRRPDARGLVSIRSSDSPGSSGTTSTSGAASRAAARNSPSGARR